MQCSASPVMSSIIICHVVCQRYKYCKWQLNNLVMVHAMNSWRVEWLSWCKIGANLYHKFTSIWRISSQMGIFGISHYLFYPLYSVTNYIVILMIVPTACPCKYITRIVFIVEIPIQCCSSTVINYVLEKLLLNYCSWSSLWQQLEISYMHWLILCRWQRIHCDTVLWLRLSHSNYWGEICTIG